MKLRLLWLFVAAIMVQVVAAQSEYISYSSKTSEDRPDELLGAGGILILSTRGDLVITITNADKPIVTPKGMRKDGFYEYEVVVDRAETSEPKVEVNRRGDVNKVDFVVKTRPDYFRAYVIEEVQKPIRKEDLQSSNDAILDASLAQVEISSTLTDLQVQCPAGLGAKITREHKKTDNSIIITTVTIPVATLEAAREKAASADAAMKKLHQRIVVEASDDPSKKGTDAEYDKLDRLEDEAEKARMQLEELSSIYVYGTGTNRLQIDISGLGPRSKMVYGILLLKTVEKVHVTECSSFMAEGARLFGLREYDAARRAFHNARNAKDTPGDLIPTIDNNIAQCDTCILYDKYSRMSLSKMKEMRKAGEASQSDVVKYATGAAEFLSVLNKYNPQDFYTNTISRLNKLVEDMPLDIRFTIAKWVNDFSGFFEAGPLPGVELWAYYGDDELRPHDYQSDRRFRKLTNASTEYSMMGNTDEKGEIDLHLVRKNLPKGIFFRPVGYDGRIRIKYLTLEEILSKSEGDYQKRQFRLKMYTAEK